MSEFVGTFLGVSYGLSALTWSLGILVQTMPVPRKEIRVWGPCLMMDSVVSLFALGSVNLVQILMRWVSEMVSQSIGSPFNNPSIAMATVLSQLTMLDTALLLLISAVSVTVVLAPVASALSSMFSHALTWVTTAIVLWLIAQWIITLLPEVWVAAYTLGIVFFAIPFRIGRKLGTLLMASSIVLAIGFPLMPFMAIWLEGNFAYENSLRPLQDLLSQVRRNPLAIVELIATLPSILGNLLVAVIISLVIFPFAYIFVLSVLTKSLSNVLGGATSGPSLSSFTIAPARELSSLSGGG